MDFFQAQDQARRNTRRLVVYFLLAIAAIIASVYLVVAGALAAGTESGAPAALWQVDLFLVVSLVLLTLILGGTAYKSIALSQGGGSAVAEMLGGRLVHRATGDPAEQRLLNIVDEMAIASGVPVPAVYLLDDERTINAFAAGVNPSHAVVAVTRGTLEQLSREELQGVVAHEFSHILNGDMRLNIRLIGVLHGLLLLTLLGRILVRSGGRSRNGAGTAVLGVALIVLGYLGVLFGGLIKAAVSRQREYLADAAAVQFTRNPGGISGALKKIGGFGSRIDNPRAEEVNHMLFCEGSGLSRLFATHPPVQERIRRLDPAFNPVLREQMRRGGPGTTPAQAAGFAAGAVVEPEHLAATIGEVHEPHVIHARELMARLPEKLLADLHRPSQANRVIYALLLDPAEHVASAQLGLIEEMEPGAARAVREHAVSLRVAGNEVRLPVVDLALPALAELDQAERQKLLARVDRLLDADGRVQLFEYALRIILQRSLGSTARGQSRHVEARLVREDLALLLSLLARAGSSSEGEALAAFTAAARHAPLDGPWNLKPPGVRLDNLNDALARLESMPPRFKRKIIEACAAAVIHDGKVTVNEGELLRAICEALECPMPPLLPGQPQQAARPIH